MLSSQKSRYLTRTTLRRRAALSLLALVAATLAFAAQARAVTIQAPIGGDALTIPRERILCGAAPAGWSTDITRRKLRPPAVGDPGRAITVIIAPNYPAC